MPAAMRAFFMAQYGSKRGAFVWARVEENAGLRKKSPASACAEPGSARSGAEVKGRLAFAKTSASMGFRRADWLKRGAKRTLVRERRTKAKMPHKTQRSVGCVRRSEDRRQKSPASACAEPGSARSGAKAWEIKCQWHFISQTFAPERALPGSALAEAGPFRQWHFISPTSAPERALPARNRIEP